MKSIRFFNSSNSKYVTRLLTNQQAFYSTASNNFSFKLDEKQFQLHKPKGSDSLELPELELTLSKERCLEIYRLMALVRKFEVAADQQYKKRNIRGFCHLYDGQEAVCIGAEMATTKDDHVITAYRDHAHQLARGDTTKRTMAELFGKYGGCSMGKGGSMHMYLREKNFFGGNGIVGAQVPVGAGLALGLQYMAKIQGKENNSVALSYYGDGASNQGQVFESYNIAKLWNLPVIFVCEDNKYGMGTSVSRSSASTDYYKRGDYVPGIKVDGMDVCAVIAAVSKAKEWALKNGPIVLHAETYRYHGHSMSDPGVTYRTRDEIKSVRTSRDPILKFKERIIAAGAVTEDELKAIDKDIKKEVDECVQYAIDAELPPASELATQIYSDKEYTAKGRTADELHHVKQ